MAEQFKALLKSFVREETSAESSTLADKNSSARSTRPRDRSAFMERLKTFTSCKWFAKPAWLSPPLCAQLGWENVDVDTLRCTTCKAHLSAYMPKSHEATVYKECCQRIKDALHGAHLKSCTWRSYPSPDIFLEAQLPCHEEFINHIRTLVKLGEALPYIQPEMAETLTIDERFLADVCNELQLSDDGRLRYEVVQSACALVVCGWYTTEHRRNPSVHCEYCQRELGLWNYISLSDKECDDELRTKKPRRSDSGDEHCCPSQHPTAGARDSGDTSNVLLSEDQPYEEHCHEPSPVELVRVDGSSNVPTIDGCEYNTAAWVKTSDMHHRTNDQSINSEINGVDSPGAEQPTGEDCMNLSSRFSQSSEDIHLEMDPDTEDEADVKPNCSSVEEATREGVEENWGKGVGNVSEEGIDEAMDVSVEETSGLEETMGGPAKEIEGGEDAGKSGGEEISEVIAEGLEDLSTKEYSLVFGMTGEGATETAEERARYSKKVTESVVGGAKDSVMGGAKHSEYIKESVVEGTKDTVHLSESAVIGDCVDIKGSVVGGAEDSEHISDSVVGGAKGNDHTKDNIIGGAKCSEDMKQSVLGGAKNSERPSESLVGGAYSLVFGLEGEGVVDTGISLLWTKVCEDEEIQTTHTKIVENTTVQAFQVNSDSHSAGEELQVCGTEDKVAVMPEDVSTDTANVETQMEDGRELELSDNRDTSQQQQSTAAMDSSDIQKRLPAHTGLDTVEKHSENSEIVPEMDDMSDGVQRPSLTLLPHVEQNSLIENDLSQLPLSDPRVGELPEGTGMTCPREHMDNSDIRPALTDVSNSISIKKRSLSSEPTVLNPLAEHRQWCAWVAAGSGGWKLLVQKMRRPPLEESPSHYIKLGHTAKAKKVFRSLLQGWTPEPKTQPK